MLFFAVMLLSMSTQAIYSVGYTVVKNGVHLTGQPPSKYHLGVRFPSYRVGDQPVESPFCNV